MKRGKHAVLGLSLALVMVGLLAQTVSAQTYDDKWFKVNFQCTTMAVDRSTGAIKPYNFSSNVYFHFYYSKPSGSMGAEYIILEWSQPSPGIWGITDVFRIQSSSYNEHLYPVLYLTLCNPYKTRVSVAVTAYVSAQPAAFRAGGQINLGVDSKGRELRGWISMSGTVVAPPPFWIH